MLLKPCLVALAILIPGAASASIVRVSEADFIAGSGLITFSEYADGTVNPTYAPATYGGGAGSPTVTFDGYFAGQSLSTQPGIDCPGAAATACVVGNPTGGLSLDAASPNTFITSDGSNPTSPVLSGSPTFNGPIAILFDTDQFGVGFDAGYFNAIGSTGITAFARDGTLLGTVSNLTIGVEFLGLISTDPNQGIAGVFLDLVGSEPAGFAIDNVRFGVRGQVIPGGGGVPEPAVWAMMILGMGGVGAVMRRRRAMGFAAFA